MTTREIQRVTHSEKESTAAEWEWGNKPERKRNREGARREACRGREGAMTLSVKYFEEMKKQVNILERDEKKRVNFSVHCECLVWIYSPFVLLETLKNSLCACVCVSLHFSLSLCILTVKIISLYSDSLWPSQQSALLSLTQTCRDKCARTSHVWHKPDKAIIVNICECLCVSSPRLVQTRHCLIGSVPITANIKQWAHLAPSLPADAYKCNHHRFPFSPI